LTHQIKLEEFDMTLNERFWSKVDKTGDCWIWKGSIKGKGYGQFYIGIINGRKTQVYAHRYSWELTNGEIPDGMEVLHSCDTPLCVKTSHLFLGTQQDNLLDCRNKGRSVRGDRNFRKLTPVQVKEIKVAYGTFRHPSSGRGQKLPNSQTSLAERYGVTRELIRQIVNGRVWTWLN
jgi:hypothetical protein